jgi:hypothetical protein
MNDAPAPLPPEAVDDLLSAELDGDFDAAATNLGLAPDVARARLAATPDVEQRRASLTRSRDALGVVDPVDDVLQERLIAKGLRAYDDRLAVRRMERSRRSRQIMSAAAIAAAVLVVVGVIAAVRGTPSTSSKSSSASPGSTAPAAAGSGGASAGAKSLAPSSNANFGEVSNANVLRQRVLDNLQLRAAAASGAAQDHAATSANGATASKADDCQAQLAPTAGRGAALQFTGTGTVNGAPVRILVFLQSGGSHVVFVSTSDCRIVNEQVLPRR